MLSERNFSPCKICQQLNSRVSARSNYFRYTIDTNQFCLEISPRRTRNVGIVELLYEECISPVFLFLTCSVTFFLRWRRQEAPGEKKVRAEVQGRRYLGEELPFHFLHFLSSFAFHSRSPFLRYLVVTSQGRSPHPSSPPSPRPRLRRAIQVNHIFLLFIFSFFLLSSYVHYISSRHSSIK